MVQYNKSRQAGLDAGFLMLDRIKNDFILNKDMFFVKN